jgi:glyoxylase I family protein
VSNAGGRGTSRRSGPPGRGLPGLRRLDHIGFTVPDFEQARWFLVDVLGCEYLYSNGPFRDDEGTWMLDHLDVPADTVMRRLHFFELAGHAVFEVFEYEATDQAQHPPRNCDVGGHHVALYVDDLEAAVAHLRTQGVTVLGTPTASGGPSRGQRWIYVRAPWGMYFELVSYPDGKEFFRDRATDATA